MIIIIIINNNNNSNNNINNNSNNNINNNKIQNPFTSLLKCYYLVKVFFLQDVIVLLVY